MKYISTLIIIIIIITFCITSYFCSPQKSVSNFEMRSLATFNTAFYPNTDSIVYKKTFFARLEEAMKDQFVFRDTIVEYISAFKAKLSNFYDSVANYVKVGNINKKYSYLEYEHPKLEKFEKQEYTLSKIGDFYRIENTDYLCEKPNPKQYDLSLLSLFIPQLNYIQERYPQIKIYSYLITSVDMTPWFDSYLGITTPDYLEQIAQLLSDNIKVKRLTYKDFEEYKNLFFATDHHLNSKGSYKTYLDIYNMISEDIPVSEYKKPVKEWNFTNLFGIKYRGSRAQRLKKVFSGWDEFIIYEYDLGNRQTYALNPETLKEEPVVLSLFDNYKNGKFSSDMYYDHYIYFYGNAILENGITINDQNYIYVIRNNTKTKHNLLFITDSSGRAIRDVTGTHFDTLVYLDFRVIQQINIDYLIDKYKIDTILVNGFGDIWTNEQFIFHFSEDFYTKESN